MAADKYQPTKHLPVIGSAPSALGHIVEVAMVGSQFEQIQIASIFPGIRAFSFQLDATGARALAGLLTKAADIAAAGEQQRLEQVNLAMRSVKPDAVRSPTNDCAGASYHFNVIRFTSGPLVKTVARLARGREVLFHGTRYPLSILRDGQLLFSRMGDPRISFTRLPEVADHWAGIERDDDDGIPAILILDRQALRSRYPLRPYHYSREHLAVGSYDEAEEYIAMRDVPDLARYLTDVVCFDRDAEKINQMIEASPRSYSRRRARQVAHARFAGATDAGTS